MSESQPNPSPELDAVAAELKLPVRQVSRVAELLAAGNTIPFIARYRKEVTGGLDEIQLRQIEDSVKRLRELQQRKATILKTLAEQDLLTPELRAQVDACRDRQVLEDLYLPFKPKRRTRASTAREQGLQPLADLLLAQTRLPETRNALLQKYVNPEAGVPDKAAALAGACDIVAEVWSEDADTRTWLTQQAFDYGALTSQVKRGKREAGRNYEMYFDFRESVKRIPSHRVLAIKRGEADGVLRGKLQLNDEHVLRNLTRRWVSNPQFEFRKELLATAEDSYQRLLLPAIESVVLQRLKESADKEAIDVFAANLRKLLLAAPAGPRTTLGMDPGFRTGCKCAVVDGTGKFLESTTIYPTPPRNDTEEAGRVLLEWISRFEIQLIAIGNGTASRETEAFVTDLLQQHSELKVTKVTVSESGASIYSASELAAEEYPDLDVTVRGAISIAHRLQDPLAELVKIDPKSIGVGQYQHDVNQTQLRDSLSREVESCVNLVGVDLNMASKSLLMHISGIGPKLAARIVSYRDECGRFRSRRELNEVPTLGKKAFEQAAGFLRINEGADPLDASAVHPESYPVVKRMADQLGTSTADLVGNSQLVSQLDPQDFVDERVGLYTVQDILEELTKPGRDPRESFKEVKFAEGITEIEHLKPGMVLDGVVTNVTNFGAFVDLGVHQDALIHVSELANHFVKDPAEEVSVGDVVRVKVLQVDVEKKRIGVSRKQVSG